MCKKKTTTHVLVLCADSAKQVDFETLFGISGLSAEYAISQEELQQKLTAKSAHVLLISVDEDPDITLAFCTKMKEAGSAFRDIPVVLIFPEGTPKEVALQSLHSGAYDYLVEPFNEIELLTKVAVLAKIKHAEDEFRQLAIRDPLTGLYDHRYLYIRFAEEISRAKRYRRPISCLLIDLQGFEAVNEKYGSEAGDLLLQMVGDSLTAYKREIDVLARLGGDQFVLVLYNTDREGAAILANRLQKRIANLKCKFDQAFRPGTYMGLVSTETNPDSVIHYQALLDNAAAALLDAKKRGAGSIVVFEP